MGLILIVGLVLNLLIIGTLIKLALKLSNNKKERRF